MEGNALLAPFCDRVEGLAHAQAGRPLLEAALATYERLACAPRGRAVRARLRAPS
jgi:hypothetical protein